MVCLSVCTPVHLYTWLFTCCKVLLGHPPQNFHCNGLWTYLDTEPFPVSLLNFWLLVLALYLSVASQICVQCSVAVVLISTLRSNCFWFVLCPHICTWSFPILIKIGFWGFDCHICNGINYSILDISVAFIMHSILILGNVML